MGACNVSIETVLMKVGISRVRHMHGFFQADRMAVFVFYKFRMNNLADDSKGTASVSPPGQRGFHGGCQGLFYGYCNDANGAGHSPLNGHFIPKQRIGVV